MGIHTQTSPIGMSGRHARRHKSTAPPHPPSTRFTDASEDEKEDKVERVGVLQGVEGTQDDEQRYKRHIDQPPATTSRVSPDQSPARGRHGIYWYMGGHAHHVSRMPRPKSVSTFGSGPFAVTSKAE